LAIKGTIKQAVMLGLAATLSHTAVVWLIAMGGMFISRRFTAEAVEPWMQIISAVIILGQPHGCSGVPGKVSDSGTRVTTMTTPITITTTIMIIRMPTLMLRVWSSLPGRQPESEPAGDPFWKVEKKKSIVTRTNWPMRGISSAALTVLR
jgi:hypothetical protein